MQHAAVRRFINRVRYGKVHLDRRRLRKPGTERRRNGRASLGLEFVAAAFGIGYLAGAGKDHLEDVGGLGTAQRNTAAGVIIATQNFSDYPNVLVMITLANTLGILMLLLIAKALSRDNKVETETV